MLNRVHENYPLNMMKHECSKRGLDFIVEFGVKQFLYNGNYFGLTTTERWNNKVKTPEVIYQSKTHYLGEVYSYLKNGVEFVLRNQDLAKSSFLLSLAESEVCNGLAVYTKNHTGVVAYFFTAKHNDREAMGFFINHLELFKSITNIVDTHLLEVNYWTKDFIVVETKTLFDDTERRLIFDDIKKLNTYPSAVIVGGKNVNFSGRQTQLLDALKYNKTTKDIASALCLETRTVEWHLAELRKKVGVSNKKELMSFAETLC